MQLSDKRINQVATVVGLLLVAGVVQNMHYNPRWYGDNGPGVGKLPREIVAGYIDMAYDQGKFTEANKGYYTSKTIDLTPNAPYRADGAPLKDTIREVVAEGQNVAVHHCVDPAGGQPGNEVVDMFRTTNGRIVWRKTIAQPIGGSCKDSSLSKHVDLGFDMPPPPPKQP